MTWVILSTAVEEIKGNMSPKPVSGTGIEPTTSRIGSKNATHLTALFRGLLLITDDGICRLLCVSLESLSTEAVKEYPGGCRQLCSGTR
jgi:hypothetical protein